MTGPRRSGRRLLFVVTEDWAFLRHRLPMAKAALRNGFEVAVATQISRHAGEIAEQGIRPIHIPVRRAAIAPFADLAYLMRLAAIMQEYRPDIVHAVATKPILYGTIAARLARVPSVVNAFTGMGILFHQVPGAGAGSGQSAKGRLLLNMIRQAANRRGIHFLVQNEDDRGFIYQNLGTPPSRAHLIPGSGVDTGAFAPVPEPASPPVVATLVGRLLWSKGVGEFVAAARALKSANAEIRMVLVGTPDHGNPTSVTETDLKAWADEGVIEWWGHQDDVQTVWAKSHIAVLPSRREGLPKSLLEAAACGRPMIATDVPGCRAIVKHGENGFLCPLGDAGALASVIERLASDTALRQRMGQAARKDVEARLSADVIGGQIGDLYNQLCTEARA